LLTCDVLVLDELGYLPTESAFGPAIYEIIAGRYERRPTIITSNKSLTEWGSIVQDPSLAAAIVDRLSTMGRSTTSKVPRGASRDEPLMETPYRRRRRSGLLLSQYLVYFVAGIYNNVLAAIDAKEFLLSVSVG